MHKEQHITTAVGALLSLNLSKNDLQAKGVKIIAAAITVMNEFVCAQLRVYYRVLKHCFYVHL
jgi:hypothetical protein